MTERQYQTIKAAFWWVLITGILYAVFGSAIGCTSPTNSSDVSTQNEALAVAFAQCHGEFQDLGHIEVVFNDTGRGDGAKAWAWPGSRTITLLRSWVNSTDAQQLELTVAHEVCHCKGLFSLAQADFCAGLAYRDAGCR